LRPFLLAGAIQLMKRLFTVFFISLLTTSSMAADLATSFKQAVELADKKEGNDRATRIYAAIDLNDYYQQKYMPIFQSCLKSTEHADTSPFSFVADLTDLLYQVEC
jgi:hypothetical protein